MTKTLRKAYMKRSELASKYHKTKNTTDCNSYKKQRKFYSKLYRKETMKFYNSLNVKDITDNKKLWKILKSLLSDKETCVYSKINLFVDEEKFSDEKEVVETFNNILIM